jgi:PD-(D/E)XK nuclease superfamily
MTSTRRSTLIASPLYWEHDDKESIATPDAASTIASMWFDQVEAYDRLPRERRLRDASRITFSPSKADACLREIYYDWTNATADIVPEVAWKARRARNGDAYHTETQRHHRKMHEVLAEAGLSDKTKFIVLAVEISGKAIFDVTLNGVKRKVRISGRADVLLQYVGESMPGVIEHGDIVGLDLKSKDRLKALGGVKFRFPTYTHAQMTSYTLLRFKAKEGNDEFEDIGRWLVHFESLQKPDKQTETESKDVYVVVVEPTDADKRAVLTRFATAVEAIEEKRLPAAELDRCMFCVFKQRCNQDGGYVDLSKTDENK